MIGVGFTLPPDDEFLGWTVPIAKRADYLEITPETTWLPSREGVLTPNGFHARFLGLVRSLRKPVVAHGVGMSMGSAVTDAARQARWLARMREDQRLFEYAWWSDHLGSIVVAGEMMTLPMPLAMNDHTASLVQACLDAMAEIVPDAAVENTAFHFTLGDPLQEPPFLRKILGGRHHLVLDLHNVYTMAKNLDFDPRAWLDACDLDRVIEIHVSGGSESHPQWLPSRRSLRLDGHDGAVPEEVWSLLEETLPRCTNVRGVTLERMEGTVRDRTTVHHLELEMERIRDVIARARGASS